MKTSVKNLMMSFALMGCLIIGASDASAQGRSRSQGGSTNRSQSAAVSRSSNSSAPTVSRSSSASSQVSRSSSSSSSSSRSSSATPQVSRSSSSSSTTPQVSRSTSTSSRSTSVAPQVNRSSSTSSRGTVDRSTGSTGRTTTVTTPTSGSRTTTGATTRGTTSGNTQSKSGNVAPRDNKTITSNSMDHATLNKGNATTPDNRPDVTLDKGDKNRGNGGKDRNGGNMGNDRGGNKDRNGGNMGNGRGGNKDRNGNRGGNKDRNGNRGGNGNHDGNRGHNGNHGYSPNNHYDYSNHHYRDQFSWNYSHHSWSRPLPPPARVHRPAPLVWYRPVIPVGWRPYASAPVIDRILGLMFGTLYEASLDHLYYNGYYIDGYADGIIYLRDVPMLNLYWPDVMLNYELNKLVNAQFIYHSSYYDRARFDRVYRSLCRIYGSPVFQDGMTISWYGGNNTGWVTLTMNESYGDYYTTMSIGY